MDETRRTKCSGVAPRFSTQDIDSIPSYSCFLARSRYEALLRPLAGFGTFHSKKSSPEKKINLYFAEIYFWLKFGAKCGMTKMSGGGGRGGGGVGVGGNSRKGWKRIKWGTKKF